MEDDILKFHPDTVTVVRKWNNLERQEEIDQLVDSLRDWLKKQYHLTKKDYSREYLERCLILTKGSVEKVKIQIGKICSLRTILPKIFQNCDARNGYNSLNGVGALALLPQLTEDHYRIFTLKILGDGLTKKAYADGVSFIIFFCEYLRMRDYVNGLVIILDYRDVNVMEYLTAIDFTEVHSFITILVHGYGMRIKNIHAITSSKRLKAIVDILKKMFGPKMASRFQIHDDVKTLHEYVPKNILPSELGGEERSIVTLFEEWRDVLSNESNKQFFKEMSRAVSNESSRMKEKLSGMDLGLAGSFRSLSVD
ncbi:hypothetical protein O3G_MSEX010228 [Manduca sexta]|uniref:CRAL-TRIO domain-containing protein n=2 Tax=Manduca sexta TaxID=7130 RepID=A0A921ZIN2_MANSE|nr:hypothetical protein O3G_MSEX010228 [Manduca sexta]